MNRSLVLCKVLTVASWPAYRLLRRQVRWYSHLFKNFPQLVVIHKVKGFTIVNEAEVDAFLKFHCFLYDPISIDNLISGSSAFSKPSLYIWKFLVHVLLKPNLMDFEHYLANMRNECSCSVIWTFFGIGMKTDHFQSYSHCWVFPVRQHIECSSFTASSFRIWNSSTGIPSPPLSWFLVMLSKVHLTLHSRISGSRLMTTPLWLSGSWRSF